MNGRVHNMVGVTSGAVVAFQRSDGQDFWKRLIEAAGGGIGGYVGARGPDALEPAVSSWHRDVAHSATTGAVMIKAAQEKVASWESYCREWADEFAARRQDANLDDLHRILYFLAEIAFRAAAGFLSGAVAGYISHLLLDATTPRGIPLLTKALV